MRGSWRFTLCLVAVVLAVGGLVTITAGPAAADSSVSLTATTAARVLYGAPSSVSLSATNTSGTVLYNASFAAVLPLGVSYVTGSTTTTSAGGTAAAGDPTIYPGVPAAGQTTLVWANVGDLQLASTQGLAFEVQGQTDAGTDLGPDPVLPGGSYQVTASVYANSSARYVPSWAAGVVVPTSYTNSAGSSATTTVVPISTTLTDPWSQGEALRGAHRNQFTYTLTTTNNDVRNTGSVSVTDWIPAGVEFLGCGGIDATTNAAGTNPGSTDEYPGSGGLNVSAPLSSSACPTPTSVTTVTDPTEPDGTHLSGVFTQVTWAVGTLTAAPGGNVSTIQFVAAIPLRANTTTWSGSVPPTTGAQGANLDNNNGPETYDGEVLASEVVATGTYAGSLNPGNTNPVATYAGNSVTAVDIKVVKSITPQTFVAGNVATVSLRYQTSEYRYASSTSLTDTLPSGMCPLSSTTNYATDTSSAQCVPQAGVDPSVPYTNVLENSDGSFAISWNLGTVAPTTDQTLSFPALMRPDYINHLSPSTPVVAGDGLADQADITAATDATCFTGTPSSPTADPTCSAVGTQPIYSGEAVPANPAHGSTASQGTASPVLVKRIATPPTGGTVDCATANYVVPSSPSYPPSYQAGDRVCFQIEMDFPQGTMTRDPTVTDFLPMGATYVTSSLTSSNTVTVPSGQPTDAGTTPDSVTWTMGDPASGGGHFVSSGQVFEVDIEAALTAPPTAGNNFTLTGNLAKATALDTAGQGISLRAQASYNLTRPLLSLTKAVTSVNGVAVTGAPPAVSGGDRVGYTITLDNTGLVGAESVPVWDNLPGAVSGTAPDDCATVISNAAVSNGSGSSGCASGTRLQWDNLTVPPATLDPTNGVVTPATITLTYTMTVPTDVSPGQVLLNHAGVVSYQGTTLDTGSATQTYSPPNNIDPGAPADPSTTTRADATAQVSTPSVAVTKTRTTGVTEPGNNAASQATIGEDITYTVAATIPADTAVSAATLTDPLGTADTGQQNLVAGSTVAAYNGGALPAGFTVVETNNTPSVVFPAVFGPIGTPTVISMTFTAVVNNVVANARTKGINNTATFAYHTATGVPLSSSSPVVTTTVVEPNLHLAKADSPGGPYAPGATVAYTLTLTNPVATDVATAHDVTATDTLPTGVTPVAGSISNGGVASESSGIWSIAWVLGSGVTIAPGGTQALTYRTTLPVTPIGHSTFTNNASATVTSLDVTAHPGARTTGTGYAATAQDQVTVTGITVAKTASPTKVTNGVDTTYTATLTVPAGTTFPQATAIDTLPSGMVFDAYGAVACQNADGSACGSDVAIASIGSPVPGSNGKTPLAWWLGNLAPGAQTRTITLTYTAHPATTYLPAPQGPVLAGTSLSNSIGAYWQNTSGTAPTAIPTPSSYAFASATATAAVEVVGPQVTVTKATSTNSPQPGVPFTYTLTVANAGSAATSCAYAAVVTDHLPTGVVNPTGFVASQGSASYTAGVVTWDPSATAAACPMGPGLAPGTSATLTFLVTLAASSSLSTGQVITNTATIADYYGVPSATATATPGRYITYGPVSGSVPVTPVFPVLAATKATPGGTAAFVGAPFSWSFSLTDPAAAPAYSVGATDVLPAHWTYDAGSTTITFPDGTTLTGSGADPTTNLSGTTETLTWAPTQLRDLTGGTRSVTVDYTSTPQTGAALGAASPDTNSVSAVATDATGAPGNASGPYASNTATASAYIAAADLSIAKTVGTPGGLVAGASGDYYDVTVHNLGPSAAAAPVVTDTVPVGAPWTITSASGTGWSCTVTAGVTASCTATGPLASGATAAPVQVTVSIPSDYGSNPITNTAGVSSSTYDPDPSNNSATVTTTVGVQADLSIAKTHVGTFTAGATGTYQVTVTNNGPSDSPAVSGPALPVEVTDTLPTGTTYRSLVPGSSWSCAAGSPTVVVCSLAAGLANGASSSFDLDVGLAPTIADGTSLTNTVGITSTTVTDPNPTNDHASDVVVVGTSADLSIAKTHAPTDTFVPGTDAHYSLAVANVGPSSALAPVVTDNLDPTVFDSVTASGSGWSCSAVGLDVTCTAGSALGSGSSAGPIGVVAHLRSAFAGGAVANTATVTSTTPDPDPSNNSATDTSSSGSASADLSVSKTHSGSFTAGGTGTYTIIATNSGPSDAVDPQLVDTLPVGMTYRASILPPGWTATPSAVVPGVPQTVTFTTTSPTATLPDTAQVHFALTVGVASSVLPTVVTNSVTVSSITPDPLPAGNTAQDPTQIVTSADLSIVKTHAPTDTFTPGTRATYDFAVSNLGPSDAADPTVVDVLPQGLTYVPGSMMVSGTGPGWSCAASGSTVTCAAGGPLVNGASQTVSIGVLIASSYLGGAFVNTATIGSATPDPQPTDNSSTASSPVPVPSADLSITKTAVGAFVPGSPTGAGYALAVANSGPSDAAAPRVVDVLPPGSTYVSASGSGWTCSDVGQTVGCSFDTALGATQSAAPISLGIIVDPGVTQPITNTATVTSTTPDPVPGNNTSTVVTPVTPSADLSITKSHAGNLVIGGDVNYTLDVVDNGPSDAAAPTVVDVLPTGLTYTSAGGTDWTCSDGGQTVTCQASGFLATGASAGPITLVASVGAAAYPSVTNTATVSSTTPDPDPSNNTAHDPGTVEPLADLSITKTAGAPVAAGQDLTYTLATANLGPTLDPGPITVTDILPTGLTYVSGSGAGWTCGATGQTVTCTRPGPFDIGTGSPITVVTTVGATAVPQVTNTASVAGTAVDPDPSNNTSTVSTAVTPASRLLASKSLSGGTLTSGSRATYSIAVANQGPSTVHGVVVTDDLPAGLSFVSAATTTATTASSSGWTCSAVGQAVTCPLGGVMAAGTSAAFDLVVQVHATGGSIANMATVASSTVLLPSSVTTASTPPVLVGPASPSDPGGGQGGPTAGGGGGSGQLALTGLDPWELLVAAAALLASGLVLVAAGRQRRTVRRPS